MVKNILFIIFLSLLSGCAFMDVNLETPVSDLQSHAKKGNNREISVVTPFFDERSPSKDCGMVKNEYSWHTADVICKTSPSIWISKLLADELRASGFNVIENSKPKNKNTLVIEGTVTKVFVEPVVGWWSGSMVTDLDVNLKATTQSGFKAERKFFSQDVKKGRFYAFHSYYQDSLNRATDRLLKNIVESIISLMDTYPQLGNIDKSITSQLINDQQFRKE